MSVVTTWDITAKTDVLSILEARGALKKIAAYETVVYNWTDDESGRRPVSVPVTRYRCELDLSVLSPEMYKEHYECIRKRGVQVPGPVNLDYACRRYLKSPECPASLKGTGGIRWNSKERGRCLKKGEMTPSPKRRKLSY